MHDHGDMRSDQGPERLRRQFTRLLGMTTVQAHRIVHDALGDVDAHKYHFAVLAALDEFGPASQAELSDRTRIYRSDLVATLNELAADGYVERAPDPADRRRNIITMTESGAGRLRRLDTLLLEADERVLGPLAPEEREQLFDLIRRVNDHLANGPDTASREVRGHHT